MAVTVLSDVFDPTLLTDTVQSRMAQQNVFKDSLFIASGAAIVVPSFTGGKSTLGQTIDIPYFGGVGTFQENVADGAAAVPRAPAMTSEQATVTRDTLAFEITAWAQSSASDDPYEDATDSLMMSLSQQMDKRCVDAAAAAGALTSTTTGALNYNKVIDGKARFRDDKRDIVAMIIHSETERDLLKEADADGRPLLIPSQNDGGFSTFAGIPVGVSNRVPVTGSSMGAVTSTGATPPVVTLAGTPSDAWDLHIDIVTGGLSDGTATFQFSTDDGTTVGGVHVVPSGGGAFILDESPQAATAANSRADSLVGINGSTGITATFANGTYSADNIYRAEANMTLTSLIVQRGAVAWWFNQALLRFLTDEDILSHTDIAAMHLYGVAKRYRRRVGGERTGVLSLVHGSGTYNGTLDD